MRRLSLIILIAIATPFGAACGASQPAGSAGASEAAADGSGGGGGGEEAAETGGSNEFQLSHSENAGQAHGDHPSEIEATATEAAMRLFVVDPEAGPIRGVVVKMTAPDGAEYYTGETDTQGYAEVLVPVGQRYGMEYLSLGRRTTTANVEVPTGPRQDIRLTLRYRRFRGRPRPRPRLQNAPAEAEPPRFVLDGVFFDSNRATLTTESSGRLDRVVEYMTHKPSARLRVAGHTDNVGNPRDNQSLSERRAQAVREYLIAHGIDGGRIEAVGYGDQQPVAPNDTEEGRQKNRRIEAIEL